MFSAAESAFSNPLAQAAGAALYADVEQRVRNARSRSRGRQRFRPVSAPSNMITDFGDEPGSSDSKRSQTVETPFGTTAMCTIIKNNVTNIAKDTTGDDLDLRERDTAVIKGFKVCMEVQNTNVTEPMYYNVAVLVPRDEIGTDSDDFFRAQGGTSRTDNFDPASLSANELHCLPINTDKFIILKHKRFRLSRNNANSNDTMSCNVDFYMPINRQLRWDDATGTPRKDIFLVRWASFFGRTAGTAAASGQNDTSETYQQSCRVVTYFADPAEYANKRPRYANRRNRRTNPAKTKVKLSANSLKT